ncbi:MAG TPA: DUF4262 domain-containing protein [Burkholderia sp.]|nr:DUF4262 domain-containing protein [Burkholderia sp.]
MDDTTIRAIVPTTGARRAPQAIAGSKFGRFNPVAAVAFHHELRRETPPVPDAAGVALAKAHDEAHLGWNRRFYGNDDSPCVPLPWPGRDGIFPWQPEADDALNAAQPRLHLSGDDRH